MSYYYKGLIFATIDSISFYYNANLMERLILNAENNSIFIFVNKISDT